MCLYCSLVVVAHVTNPSISTPGVAKLTLRGRDKELYGARKLLRRHLNFLYSGNLEHCKPYQQAGPYIKQNVDMNYKSDRLCGLVVRVPGYRTEMYCVSCEVRTEFIYVM
jgi:hypothetical protein